jgi:hypothetical protein
MGGILTRFWHFICRLAVPTGLAISSAAICLIVLEIALRVWDGVPVFSTQNFVAAALDQVHGHGVVDYDARLGWVQTPGVERPDLKFTTGEYGVRMSSAKIVPLSPGAVLLVGDSFAAGSEVSDAESWPAQLEQLLGIKIVNAAVGGYGLDQIVLRAETLVPLLKPRMLLVQTRLEYGISVDRMSVFGGSPKPYFTVENGELALHNEPVPALASNRKEIGRARAVFGHSYLVQYVMTRLNLLQWWVAATYRTKAELTPGEAVQVGCLLMRRIADIGARNNIPVALIVQYSALEPTEQPLHWQHDREELLACAQHQSLEVVDTFEALKSSYQNSDLTSYQRLWLMQDHGRVYGHMSAAGNHLIANIIAEQLSRDFSESTQNQQKQMLQTSTASQKSK